MMRNSLFLRFFLVSLLGVVVDLALGNLCILLGFGIYYALCSGFLGGVVTSFVLHAKWTFGTVKGRKNMAMHFIKFSVSSFFILAVRFSIVYVTMRTLPQTFIWHSFSLACAVGASFLLNYMIQKYIVFRRT